MRKLRYEEYTVGWICALPLELAAAQAMLDEEHGEVQEGDSLYALGAMGGHKVVVGCLPSGVYGTTSATAVAIQMRASFKGIRFGLMVGIGGGVPSKSIDIRLGDVVVSQPQKTNGGVVQYDMGKTVTAGGEPHFERTGSLNEPPTILLHAVSRVQANNERDRSDLPKYLARLERLSKFSRANCESDKLFYPIYDHKKGEETCENCCTCKYCLVVRDPRKDEILVHYGLIASANQVMKNGVERDRISENLGGVLCFEMEAAGLMNTFPCIVIRGICDYSDSHKQKSWQRFAAGTAAAYARELLSAIPTSDLRRAPTVNEHIRSSTRGTTLRQPIDYMSQYRPAVPALSYVESYVDRFKDKERTTRSPLHGDISLEKQHNADPPLAPYSTPTTLQTPSKIYYDYSSSSDEDFDSLGKQQKTNSSLAPYSIPRTSENASKIYDYSLSSDDDFDCPPLPTVVSPSDGLPIASKPASVANNTQDVKDSSAPKRPYLYDALSERKSPSLEPAPKPFTHDAWADVTKLPTLPSLKAKKWMDPAKLLKEIQRSYLFMHNLKKMQPAFHKFISKACVADVLPILRVLLRCGLDPNDRRYIGDVGSWSGTCPHIWILRSGWRVLGKEMHIEVFKLFVEFGADVANFWMSGVDDLSDRTDTALHQACRLGSVEAVCLILKKGAKVDWTPKPWLNRTPLQVAVCHHNIGTVKCLLDHGANPNLPSSNYDEPLVVAVRNDNVNIAKLLLQANAEVNVRAHMNNDPDLGGATPIILAAAWGLIEMMQLLFEVSGQNEVHEHIRLIYLQMRGDSINLGLRTANGGFTALHTAVRPKFHPDLDLKIREKIVDILLQQGASASAVNTYGRTILHTAAANGLASIVRRLIDAGADIDYVSNKDGFTPLLCAVRSGKVEVVKVLLEKGANASPPRCRSAVTVARDFNQRYIEQLVLPHCKPSTGIDRALGPSYALGDRPYGVARSGNSAAGSNSSLNSLHTPRHKTSFYGSGERAPNTGQSNIGNRQRAPIAQRANSDGNRVFPNNRHLNRNNEPSIYSNSSPNLSYTRR